MSEYEIMLKLAYYNVMAGCESGGCAEYHMASCWQNRTCFYDVQFHAAVTALEMGWF